MTQKFIELGEGYSDFFEFEELMHYNHERINQLLLLRTSLEKEPKMSALLIMKPSRQGNFLPIYATFESISPKRLELLNEWAMRYHIKVAELEVKSMHYFHERELYYNYLIGVLRLQRILPPLN